jgi:hypothetical protein
MNKQIAHSLEVVSILDNLFAIETLRIQTISALI